MVTNLTLIMSHFLEYGLDNIAAVQEKKAKIKTQNPMKK